MFPICYVCLIQLEQFDWLLCDYCGLAEDTVKTLEGGAQTQASRKMKQDWMKSISSPYYLFQDSDTMKQCMTYVDAI